MKHLMVVCLLLAAPIRAQDALVLVFHSCCVTAMV